MILDKLLGRGEKKAAQELTLGKAEELIARMIKERADASVGYFAPIAGEILALKQDVKEIMEQLAEHEFPEEIRKRIYKPVLTSKPAYVKGILDAIDEIDQPREDFKGMEDFYRTVIAALKSTQNVQFSRGKVVVRVYQEELLKLGGVLNRITDAAKRMEEILANSRNALRGLEEASAIAAELKSHIWHSAEFEEKIAGGCRAAAEIEQKIKESEKKILSIERSQEYAEHRANERKLEAARVELKELKSKAAGFLGALSRTLRKYGKAARDKREVEIIERLTRNNDYIVRGDYEALCRILNAARECIISGELSISEREKEKTLIKINEALETLPKLFERSARLEEEERSIAAELSASSILRQKTGAEREVLEQEKKRADLEAEINFWKECRQKLEAEVQELRIKLQKSLSSAIGREVRFVVERS